ncbi:MAG: adenylate/guanylate cyclase domain-containing protein [Syntrophobacter sp.]
MFHGIKAALFTGCLLCLISLTLITTFLGPALEESLGLYVLFRIRGARPVPAHAVVVTLDQESAEVLNLPSNPLKWPRGIHAELIESLIRRQAYVIAFDVLFSDRSSESNDDLFAKAIANAGNVVLCEHLRKDLISISKGSSLPEPIHVERAIPPAEQFANSAVALAPFPLPKVPTRVSQFWTFKTESGSKPTLPFLAFQLFCLDAYDDFVRLLESTSPAHSATLPESAETILAGRSLGKVTAAIRGIFEESPWIPQTMLGTLEEKGSSPDADKSKMLKALVKAYMSSDSVFINFYGPPGTIPTIPLHRILNHEGKDGDLPQIQGKAVFIGLSEIKRAEQRDGFNTVFSKSDGTDLSGVEIAATAFSNLLEDMPVRPPSRTVFLGICIAWAFILGYTCLFIPPLVSMAIVASLVLVYSSLAAILFSRSGIWLPLAVPFAVEAPLAICAGFLWQHAKTKKERQQMRKAFGFFLPDRAIDQIMQDMKAAGDIVQSHQTVFGTVLCSDGAQYTALSEQMPPRDLRLFLNKYYGAIFRPVRTNGGTISDIIGDSMLAIWAGAHPDASLKKGACSAALEIVKTVDEFNRDSIPHHLHTRIGIHHGQLLLGNIGGGDHFEYRPVGDVVNTATRIESLNKHFGTQILASEEVISGCTGLLVRELGRFLLSGKTNPVTVFELICPLENAPESRIRLSALFSEALRAFERRMWDEAEALFREFLTIGGEDKPSLYYIDKCRIYRKDPPSEMWDGVVFFDTK